MDEKIKLELQLASSMADSFHEEEFYEEIEAPNFVDFTLPHHFCPDDRYWFCSRVGCDQRHEQEMDPDAIYKNFVLRVMAARSPNVRLQKALSRKPTSETKKCPFSAPPKSSKSRLPRLAIVSSISKKLVLDEKSVNEPHPIDQKPCSTPKMRVKHVAAKYMTSVTRKKASSPNQNGFRSVRNPKRTSVTLPKIKVVAKTLAFNSPKKTHKKVKSSEELTTTPITKLCEGLKKMKITKNKVKASEELTTTPITRLCEGMKKMKIIQKSSLECRSGRKGLPLDASNKQPSSSRRKGLPLDASNKQPSSSRRKGQPLDASNKQPNSSRSVKTAGNVIQGANIGDDELKNMEIEGKPKADSLESQSGMKSNVESDTSQEKLNVQTTEVISDSEDRISVHADPLPIKKAKEEDDQGKTNDIENQNPRLVDELSNKDGNEDGLNSDNIISENISNLNSASLSKHDAPVKRKIKTMDKSSKENCSAAIQGKMLYRKLKPTNPKPFRLRTDERGILKEATLERKANSNENGSENLQSGNELPENREKQSKKEMDKSFKQDKIRPVKSKYMSTSKAVEHKSDRVLASEKRTNPQRENIMRVKFGLSAVEESKARILKPMEPRMKPNKIVVNPTSKALVMTHKLAAQGRRGAATIPREPDLQSPA